MSSGNSASATPSPSTPCQTGATQYYVTFTNGQNDTYCLGPANAALWVPGYSPIPGSTIQSIHAVPNSYDYSVGGEYDPNNPDAPQEYDWLHSIAGDPQATVAGAGTQNPLSGTVWVSTFAGQAVWIWVVVLLGLIAVLSLAAVHT